MEASSTGVYNVFPISMHGGAFWGRSETAPHLGVTSPKIPFWGRK